MCLCVCVCVCLFVCLSNNVANHCYTVSEANFESSNITVSEGNPEVEICVALTTGINKQVIVTAETGPMYGATNPATGSSCSGTPLKNGHP